MSGLSYYGQSCKGLQGMIEQVSWDRSSSLPKNILQNTQELQLFTIIINREIIYKSNLKDHAVGLR
jgi:hypothetical protein